MVKLLEFLDRHTARHLFRSSHLNVVCDHVVSQDFSNFLKVLHNHSFATRICFVDNVLKS